MQRHHAVITIIACCLLAASTAAFSPRPSPTLNMKLAFPDLVVSVHFGTPLGTLSIDRFPIDGSDLTQCLNSWRERTTEILRKRLHMA